MNKYQVKIEDEILPGFYSFDKLLEIGLLDEFDEKIRVRLVGDNNWIIAQSYPFSEKETLSVQECHSPKIIRKWNWGAFTLSWIWGVCNNIYWPLVIVAVNFIPYIGVLLSLAICVYLGFKGNGLAWNVAKDRDVLTFEKKQTSWDNAGKIVLICSVILGLSVGVLVSLFM